MANNLTNYAENKLRDYFFRSVTSGTAMVFKDTWAVALTANVPNGASTAGNCGELANSNGYARQGLAPSDTNWSIANVSTSGQVSNVSVLTFPIATGNWGWASGVMLCDSAAYGGGNGWFWGALTNPRDIQNTDQMLISASGLVFTWD